MKFTDLGLNEPILRAITHAGYEVPTPIQQQAIPHVLAGKDVLGCAQTGTGKTAAFCLPMAQRLMEHKAPAPAAHQPRAEHDHAPGHGARSTHTSRSHGGAGAHGNHPKRPIRSLILSPTRELTLQIAENLGIYAKNSKLRHTVIFGGVGQGHQVRDLREGVDIVVATPGRLEDLMQQGYVDLRHVEIFVLDEADRMLDMGFIEPIRRIAAAVPKHRQTLLFSATMPKEIRHLANSLLTHPVSVEVAPAASLPSLIEQSVFHVSKGDKPALLSHLLRSTSITRALVFTRTKHGADKVVKRLSYDGIHAEAIHGNKRQNVRQRTLANFKSGRTPVLVATDIAARGIDVDEVSHVINYELPNEPETYVHRIGRTGRAGMTGEAMSFCDHEERSYLKQIERLVKKPIEVKVTPALPREERAPGHGHAHRGETHTEERGRRPRAQHAEHGQRGHTGGRAAPHGDSSGHRESRGGHSGGHRSEHRPAASHASAHHAPRPSAGGRGHAKPGHHAKPAHGAHTPPPPHAKPHASGSNNQGHGHSHHSAAKPSHAAAKKSSHRKGPPPSTRRGEGHGHSSGGSRQQPGAGFRGKHRTDR